jgi:hypothetical protein
MNWRNAAVALWGDDWIAPLSEVIGVNRRTIERWNSGDGQPPDAIVADLIRLPRIGSAQRAYGDLLRRLARGETIEELETDAAKRKRALARLRTDVGRFNAIAVLASHQRGSTG